MKANFDFESVMVVANSEACHAQHQKLNEKVIDPLVRRGVPLEVRDVADTKAGQHVLDNIQPGTIALVCGGDGTVNLVANSIIDNPHKSEIALAIVPFGNINDIARSVNGSLKNDILPTITSGTKLNRQYAGAAQIDTATKEKVVTTYALSCFGVGASACAAAAINQPTARTERSQSKISRYLATKTAIKALFGAGNFNYRADGEEKNAYEIIFANNKIMSGCLKFKDQSIFGNEYLTMIEVPSLGKVVMRIISQMPFGGLQGQQITDYDLVVRDAVNIQFDGEARILEPETFIKIQHVPAILGFIACHNM